MKPIFTCEDIRQYYYCPRKIYYRYVLKVRVPETYKMKYGRTVHENAVIRGDTVKNVYLYSERLGLVGIIDFLEFVDADVVDIIEIKCSRFKTKMYEDHKVQLAAQAMLVEDVLGYRVNKIKVINVETGESREIRIMEYHRNMVREALSEMQRIVIDEVIPDPTEDKRRCYGCECKAFCDDIP